MPDTITVTGLVATTPRHLVTSDGLPITSFRLCSTLRRYDRAENKWVDADTNWYTVTTFRQLATNVVGSVAKGQRVVVTGRLRVREWATEDKHGTNVEIDADALGHDLSWGTAVFSRTVAASAAAEATQSGETAGHADAGDASEAVGDGDAEPGDELAAARAQRATEAALPF
ncbi:hypothetical protein GCM10009840_27650 [Pseudolysinimonas kribbensis]|uniref:Single-stranded DNA-binding protein n=1 Tax=Pseudolysinimonas kribbensis TaxID=433641 RepID=A0ABQ6K7P1_9MICO|nr:single-stranded DNA-binding protein [Pseudolysinimonas kribbensis]GMA96419.1 hypothetical protein GCM10025881_32430 [Pseudolysinimonas kribbensis]